MDLIGGVKYIQDRHGERRRDHGKGKPAPKNARSESVRAGNAEADAGRAAAEQDTALGRMVDTTA